VTGPVKIACNEPLPIGNGSRGSGGSCCPRSISRSTWSRTRSRWSSPGRSCRWSLPTRQAGA